MLFRRRSVRNMYGTPIMQKNATSTLCGVPMILIGGVEPILLGSCPGIEGAAGQAGQALDVAVSGSPSKVAVAMIRFRQQRRYYKQRILPSGRHISSRLVPSTGG